VWGIVFIALGAAAFWAALAQRKRARGFAERAVATQATIARLETSMPGQEMTQSNVKVSKTFPVFRYTDREGRSHETRSRTSYAFDKLQVGQPLDVLYDPDNPDDVRIGMSTDNGLVFALIALGLVLIAMGVYGALG
jgi:hypothetical protein